MLVHVKTLSMWEIAHYWHDYDPRESKTHHLPLKVRDTMLVLSMDFGNRLSLRVEHHKAYLLEIMNYTPRLTARHYRNTFKKSIDNKVFGKQFFSKMYLSRSQLGRWCMLHNESLPTFWFPDNEKYPFNETGDISDELTANGRYKIQLLYNDTATSIDDSNQEHLIVTSITENAVKAANAKHARTNRIKDNFIAFYKLERKNHPSKKATAECFFNSLDEKQEKLLFSSKETAIRTFLDAQRFQQKPAK
jgi:hypothetical protein